MKLHAPPLTIVHIIQPAVTQGHTHTYLQQFNFVPLRTKYLMSGNSITVMQSWAKLVQTEGHFHLIDLPSARPLTHAVSEAFTCTLASWAVSNPKNKDSRQDKLPGGTWLVEKKRDGTANRVGDPADLWACWSAAGLRKIAHSAFSLPSL